MNKSLKEIQARKAELNEQNANATAVAEELADLEVQEFGAKHQELDEKRKNAFAADKSARSIVAKKFGKIKLKLVTFESNPSKPDTLLEIEIGPDDMHTNADLIKGAIAKLGEMTTGIEANKVRQFESKNRNLFNKWTARPKTA